MKTAILLVLVVGTVGLLIFGTATCSVVRGTGAAIKEEVEQTIPDVVQYHRIQAELGSLDKGIDEHNRLLSRAASKAQAAQERCSSVEGEVSRQEAFVNKASALLDEGRKSYEINGRSYTHDEVSADAVARVRECTRLRQELQVSRRQHELLSLAVKTGRANLVRAKAKRHEVAAELESLRIRLEDAKMMHVVNEMSAKLAGPLVPQTEIGRLLEDYRARVNEAEQKADSGAAASTRGLISWETAEGLPDAREEIRRYFAAREASK